MADVGLALTYLLIASPFFAAVVFGLLVVRRFMPKTIVTIIDRAWGHPVLTRLFAGMTGLAAVVLLLYALARITAFVPGPSVWPENHGPWHVSLPGILVWSSLALLVLSVLGSVVTGMVLATLKREGAFLVRGLMLGGVCLGYAVACGHVLYWTID